MGHLLNDKGTPPIFIKLRVMYFFSDHLTQKEKKI